MRKAKYTAAERRAYWIGVGRRLEQTGNASHFFKHLSIKEQMSMTDGSRAVSPKRK